MAQFEVRWDAPEYDHHEKTPLWYWASIGIAVIFLAFAVWQRNFLFGFFIVIAEILVMLWASKEPETVSFVLNERGIGIGDNRFHAYKEIHSYSVDDTHHDDWMELIFHLHNHYRLPVRIKLPQHHVDNIHQNLKGIVPHAHHHESLSDSLQKFFRF